MLKRKSPKGFLCSAWDLGFGTWDLDFGTWILELETWVLDFGNLSLF